MLEDERIELYRKAKFRLDTALNLIDQAANGSESTEEIIMVERSIADITHAKFRISAICQRIIEEDLKSQAKTKKK